MLGLCGTYVWKCPTPEVLAFYDRYVSARHLDVGVGTGCFLDRCRFPSPDPTVAQQSGSSLFLMRRIGK